MQSEAAGLPDYAMQFWIRRHGHPKLHHALSTLYTSSSIVLLHRDLSVQEAANYLNLSNARHENRKCHREILHVSTSI